MNVHQVPVHKMQFVIMVPTITHAHVHQDILAILTTNLAHVKVSTSNQELLIRDLTKITKYSL